MKKLIAVLIASTFAAGSVFAAQHMKADEKKDEKKSAMKKDDKKKDMKKDAMKKEEKK